MAATPGACPSSFINANYGFFAENRFIARKGEYTWRELRFMCQALGLPTYSFDIAVKENSPLPEHISCHMTKNTITNQGVRELVMNKMLDPQFHESTTLHSTEYQVVLLLKALQMLEDHLLSYSMLCGARLAFFLHEPSDLQGLRFSPSAATHILHLIGLMTSKKNLDHHLRRVMMNPFIPRRIQLFEFLDILPHCENENREVALSQSSHNVISSAKPLRGGYYRLGDFHHMETTHEQRAQIRLDKQHEEKLFKYLDLFEGEDVISDIFKKKDGFDFHKPVVITRQHDSTREQNVNDRKLLIDDLRESRSARARTRCGHVRSCSRPPTRLSERLSSRLTSRMEFHDHHGFTPEDLIASRVQRRPATTSCVRSTLLPPVQPAVTQLDIDEHTLKMIDLQFKMSVAA